MCGIAGIVRHDQAPVDAAALRSMCALMGHRGPDDSRVEVFASAGLGHRRLRIIDLSQRGANPMGNEDGSIHLVFNGEIYNYKELRRSLEAAGHRFASDTDGEVLLHLYEEHGPDLVRELNGIFAFAILDENSGRLMLARDRAGIKPLYYTGNAKTFAFASEAKAFLALPGFTMQPDLQGLAEHFAFQYTLGRRTLFKDVHLLEPGEMLLLQQGRQTLRKWWRLCIAPDEGVARDAWAERLREVFESSVKRQLMSDVPLGSYLSGGMDTGAIAAVASRCLPGMHTFTCGFEIPAGADALERFFDERQESRDLARLLGTRHHETTLGPKAMFDALPSVVWHLDEPRAGISYPGYYTSAMIARHVTVVLSGVGGDELFGGYPWRMAPCLQMQPATFAREFYALKRHLLSEDEAAQLFSQDFRRATAGFSPFDSFRELLDGCPGERSPVNLMFYSEFYTFLQALLLVDDKLSMAHSVEARTPFLDNAMLDIAAAIPARHKLEPGVGKIVLRRAMKGLLPESVTARRKQGFTPPDATWYRNELRQGVERLVLSEQFLDRGWFKPEAIARILENHMSGRRNHRFLLWSLMCLAWWCRLFLDGEGAAFSRSDP